MRLACVTAPELALQAVLRRDPDLRTGAVALVDKGRVVSLTREAQEAGIRRGMTASQARAMSGAVPVAGGLQVIGASEADTAAAEAALADVGHAFAPGVDAEPGRVFLQVGDLAGLYPAGERAIAQAIAARAARVGLAVRVAIAGSKGVARAAAQVGDIEVIPPGEERERLAVMPLLAGLTGANIQGPDADELADRLDRWGIRSLGALAALPRDQVIVRLGPRGARLHALASGHSDEPFAPRLPPDALEEGTDLEYAVEEIEPLAFVLRGLIDRALERLIGRSLGCAGLTLRLKLEPRGYEVREVPLAGPTRETAALLQLARLELGRRPPAAAVIGVSLLVRPARVRAAQLDFWRAAGPAPERMAAMLARLGALVGIDNVGTPALVDSYREEAIALQPFRSEPATHGEPDGTLHLGFRRFRPPQSVEVLMGRDGPTALRGRETTARVLVAAGPYRASGEWWASDGWSRDYWDVQASDGGVYRVHQDRKDGRWYLDGYYD